VRSRGQNRPKTTIDSDHHHCLNPIPALNFHFKIMALTHEDVRKIASLARLRFSPEEEAKLTGQLAKIVDYIDQLQAYEGAEPDVAARGVPERPDEPHECLPRERFLANAPESMDAFLLVPEVKAGGGDA
jgi:aspartyl-tRNA(Asn)/glutamyl-tRNA(Gln) amidotransferase subunit C